VKKNFQRICCSFVFAGMGFSALPVQAQSDDATPAPADPSSRLRSLAGALPQVGQMSSTKVLGLSVITVPKKSTGVQFDPNAYTFTIPGDLDRRCTDNYPYKGKYPGLHLNLPLKVQPSAINYLFVSDQPELIKDDRKRDGATGLPDPGPGATGVYARASIPARSTTRVLVDHSNETMRPLKFWLVWIPQADGFLSVHKRSESIHVNSVAAGSDAFTEAAQVAFEPRQSLVANQAVVLSSALLNPHDTMVVHLEYFASCAGQLATVFGEDLDEAPKEVAALDQLPVLHSVLWSEEQSRLGKFVDPKTDPTRYKRILSSAQHSRGQFNFPDRLAEADYNVDSWDEADKPVQVYSLFESIPGTDPTVKTGSSATDNRGKYGARVGMRLHLTSLPPGCQEVALVAVNRGGVFGGRHWVSDGHKTVCETVLRPKVGPGLLKTNQATTVWRGPARAGDTLTMWTEPVANTSVNLWYLLVPIPPEEVAPTPTAQSSLK
jgi:hypothetical protein